MSLTTGNGHDMVAVGEEAEDDQLTVDKAVTIKTGNGMDAVDVAGLTSGMEGTGRWRPERHDRKRRRHD